MHRSVCERCNIAVQVLVALRRRQHFYKDILYKSYDVANHIGVLFEKKIYEYFKFVVKRREKENN